MRYRKTLPVPARTEEVLHFPLSRLRAGESLRDFELHHIRESSEGFVCAEGITMYAKSYDVDPLNIYATDNDLFMRNQYVVPPYHNYLIVVIHHHRFVNFYLDENVNCIVPFRYGEEPYSWYVITDENTYFYSNSEEVKEIGKGYGGIYGAEYADRMFVVSPTRIVHTAPESDGEWKLSETDELQQFGILDMPLKYGEYVGGACFKGKLYVFSKYAVIEIRMGGETLLTSVTSLPLAYGEVIAGSVTQCGDRALFFTTRGLFSFDGTSVRKLVSPCADRLDLTQPFRTGWAYGNFYIHAADKTGKKVIYSYDLVYDRETFLEMNVELFVACNQIYVIQNKHLYYGIPKGRDGLHKCSVQFTLDLAPRENAYAEWVCISGEGKFTVIAETAEQSVKVTGEAGKRLYLPATLRAPDVRFTIETDDTNFRITALTFGVGKEERYDD